MSLPLNASGADEPHLLVVDDGACVVGVITRRELTSDRLRALVDPFLAEEEA